MDSGLYQAGLRGPSVTPSPEEGEGGTTPTPVFRLSGVVRGGNPDAELANGDYWRDAIVSVENMDGGDPLLAYSYKNSNNYYLYPYHDNMLELAPGSLGVRWFAGAEGATSPGSGAVCLFNTAYAPYFPGGSAVAISGSSFVGYPMSGTDESSNITLVKI